MEPVIFNYRSKFNDHIQYVCVPQCVLGVVDKVHNFTVYMYVNNEYKRSYTNLMATSYVHLNQQLNQLFENF